MNSKLTERLDLQSIIASQDVGTANVTGTFVDVSKAERFVVLAKAGAVTAGKILTVQLRQAQDAAGTGAKDLGAAVTAVGVGGAAPPDVEVEKQLDELDGANGFTHVTAVLGIDEAAKLGAAWIVLGDRRYRP